MRNNQDAHRFELETDEAARLNYVLKPGAIIFVHTEVPKQMEGKGVGAALARAGLEYARESGLQAVPRCPFVSSYIARHTEYASLLSPEDRAGLEEQKTVIRRAPGAS